MQSKPIPSTVYCFDAGAASLFYTRRVRARQTANGRRGNNRSVCRATRADQRSLLFPSVQLSKKRTRRGSPTRSGLLCNAFSPRSAPFFPSRGCLTVSDFGRGKSASGRAGDKRTRPTSFAITPPRFFARRHETSFRDTDLEQQ